MRFGESIHVFLHEHLQILRFIFISFLLLHLFSEAYLPNEIDTNYMFIGNELKP